MQDTASERVKLKPLRKFARKGVYNSAYLSQLVQRGTLKAERIGRNYYTCELWFDEYLNCHARDAKQSAFKAEIRKKQAAEAVVLHPAPQNVQYVLGQLRPAANPWKQIAIAMAVFLCLMIAGWAYYSLDNKGQVAGVEERIGSGSASSTKSADTGLAR